MSPEPPDSPPAGPPAAPPPGAGPPPDGAETPQPELPPDVRWARGFLMAARAFAQERGLSEIHIEVTLASGERFPVMSVGPGGPPGFVGFGVETDELRERNRDAAEPAPSPRGIYVPFGSVVKIELMAEVPEHHAIGFAVERDLDRA